MEKKTAIYFKLTDVEKLQIEIKANNQGISISEFIRHQCLKDFSSSNTTNSKFDVLFKDQNFIDNQQKFYENLDNEFSFPIAAELGSCFGIKEKTIKQYLKDKFWFNKCKDGNYKRKWDNNYVALF